MTTSPKERKVLTRRHLLAVAATAAMVVVAESLPDGTAPTAKAEPPAPKPGPSTPSGTGTGWMPGAERKPLNRNFTPGARDAQRGLILHVQEGEGSLYDRFSDPKQRSSAHFWVSQAGEIEQYVSVDDRAWTQGSGNPSWASVETSGFATRPLTDAQVDAVARIYAWGMAEHDWPQALADSPDARGLGTHHMGGADWGGHECPGSLRSAQREDILRRAGEPPAAPPAA
ncbi:peptidoglycan recognition protein family protein [Streptomyces sp. IBSNAI002]|uniref:peptidoglycan recognition protein family protein n=1 Tax=Streptomyces sp. IBSNAI002 TaxID=3457500 RepID=UPI003FD34BC6